ncbi:MAG: DUF4339 domain-containing protein [Bacteroidales bacterium]|nr:DUF4339 domain-containing protein [Bacteroidales bacterium]
MRKYFIHNGIEPQGPFDINELKKRGVNKDTLIWFEGLPNWTSAENIDELKDILIVSVPPPLKTDQITLTFNKEYIQQETKPQDKTIYPKKKRKVGRLILFIIIAFLLIGIGIMIGNIRESNGDINFYSFQEHKMSYEELKMAIEEIENARPEDFLNGIYYYRENFIGDKFIVECEITNEALVARYKDVVIRVTYKSKTGTEIGNKDLTFYEIFPPNSTKKLRFKIDKNKNVNDLDFEVIGATPY